VPPDVDSTFYKAFLCTSPDRWYLIGPWSKMFAHGWASVTTVL